VALLSGVSIFLSIVLASFQPGWWVTPFVLLLYGMLLSWCTKGNNDWELMKALQVTTNPARSAAPRPKAKKGAKRRK